MRREGRDADYLISAGFKNPREAEEECWTCESAGGSGRSPSVRPSVCRSNLLSPGTSPGTSPPERPRQAGKLDNEVAEQMDQQCLPFSLPSPHFAVGQSGRVCASGVGGAGGRRRLQRPVSPRHAYSTAHTPNLRLKGLPLCGRGRGRGGGGGAEQWGPHNRGGCGGQLHHEGWWRGAGGVYGPRGAS